jgi:hypothetical protein
VFRSSRRPVVFPQAEHARFAATIALAWGNGEFPKPALPFESFVRGVALHDRGYEALDTDGIGEVPRGRWLEIQRRSFMPQDDDPVVDLVVAMHVHRLVSPPRDEFERKAVDEMSAQLPELQRRARVDPVAATAADTVTDLCDRISFDLCVEEATTGGAAVATDSHGGRREVRYAIDGRGLVCVEPWPLRPTRLDVLLVGYRAERYPQELEPVVETIRVERGRT